MVSFGGCSPVSPQEQSHDLYQRAHQSAAPAVHRGLTARKLGANTQTAYVRAVKQLTDFLGRSPASASAEDLRQFQLHLAEGGVGSPTLNAALTALRFITAAASGLSPVPASPASRPLWPAPEGRSGAIRAPRLPMAQGRPRRYPGTGSAGPGRGSCWERRSLARARAAGRPAPWRRAPASSTR